ncbi:unannotated protein [freshwater metagenome]|uniref:Unannotated protein n=1 Tax=freshwater metagenome TaxID=449393 RepID=A0A6J6L8X5_9ZZZZ
MLTKSTIDLTSVVRVVGLAKYPANTSLAVPSVMVGIICIPARRIKQTVSAIGHDGLPVL